MRNKFTRSCRRSSSNRRKAPTTRMCNDGKRTSRSRKFCESRRSTPPMKEWKSNQTRRVTPTRMAMTRWSTRIAMKTLSSRSAPTARRFVFGTSSSELSCSRPLIALNLTNIVELFLTLLLSSHRCSKVRTLNGVPQPSSVCPVGEFDLAVLCKREIRVIDLNEGRFKVRSGRKVEGSGIQLSALMSF